MRLDIRALTTPTARRYMDGNHFVQLSDSEGRLLSVGDLVFDRKGNLYGSSQFGGGQGQGNCNGFYQYCGAVFELSPPRQLGAPWTEQVLYGFQGVKGGETGDGAAPNGNLVLDAAANIYGTTLYGGSATGACDSGVGGIGCGTVFRLTRPQVEGGQWTQEIIYRFTGDDGANPGAGLVMNSSGTLYGTTEFGGALSGGGTVFRLARPNPSSGVWKQTVLHNFQPFVGSFKPWSWLIFDTIGNLYGTTYSGDNQGTIYGLTADLKTSVGWRFVNLHGFRAKPDGENPVAGLTLDKIGKRFYGTTTKGGSSDACGSPGCGTVFELSRQ